MIRSYEGKILTAGGKIAAGDGCCCGNCTFCDGSTDNFDVDISGLANTGDGFNCGDCDGLYTIPTGLASCQWELDDPPGECHLNNIEVFVDFSGGVYSIAVRLIFACPFASNVIIYRKDLGTSKPACTSIDEVLDFVSDTPSGGGCCDGSTATVRVTSA